MNYGSNITKLLLPNAHVGLLLLLVNKHVSSNKPLLNNNFINKCTVCVEAKEQVDLKVSFNVFSPLKLYTCGFVTL